MVGLFASEELKELPCGKFGINLAFYHLIDREIRDMGKEMAKHKQ